MPITIYHSTYIKSFFDKMKELQLIHSFEFLRIQILPLFHIYIDKSVLKINVKGSSYQAYKITEINSVTRILEYFFKLFIYLLES